MLLCDTPCALVCTYPLYLLHFIVFLMPSRYGRKRSYNCEAEAGTVQTRLRFIAVLMFGLQADVKYMLLSPRPTASCNITNCTSPFCHQEETNIQTQANKSDPRLQCACVLVSVCLSVRLSLHPSVSVSVANLSHMGVQVRLEHMLQRLRSLQDAAATSRPTQLLPHLYVSGAVEASSLHVLRHLGITHILNATEDLLQPDEAQGFV